MSNKPTHRLVLKDEYKNKDGETKVNWTQIMSLWEGEKGITVRLPKGLSLSGTFFIFKNEDKSEGEAPGDVNEDLPF